MKLRKKEIEDREDKLKEDLIAFAKSKGIDIIYGSNMKCSIKEFDKIVKYVEDEAKSFIQLNAWLHKEMPKFLERFKAENKI